MKKENCPYCNYGEALAKFGVLAFETELSSVIVFKDQSHPGRCIVAYKNDHIAEIQDLSDEERRAYILAHNKINMNSGFDIDILNEELDNILDINMEDFGFLNVDIDWDNVEDLSNETYEEPEHNMLECPKCHHVDRDIHFKKVSGVEGEENENIDE